MIAVIANPKEADAIREFFELFKTPWEFYRSGHRYDTVICTTGEQPSHCLTKLLVLYGAQELPVDTSLGVEVSPCQSISAMLQTRRGTIPIYGAIATFNCTAASVLRNQNFGCASVYLDVRADGSRVARVGYNVFDETRKLLTKWQPAINAGIPTLDLHIALLRDLVLDSGIRLVEVPPVPAGYKFIACLTHDIDHPLIRKHKLDHTMFGFLYRATIGTFLSVIRGRMPLRALPVNWWAALKLPLVHLGICSDFWRQFAAYVKLESGARASFFVIPFKGKPGEWHDVPAPSMRASAYSAVDIAAILRQLVDEGCEVGLHGIDAWHDKQKAREELEEIRRIIRPTELGVRMHWLYLDEYSARVLDDAGAAYDSSVGYNDAVGYRAGTTQVYRPLGVNRLLELPLHIMDTALFSPGRQNLSPKQAQLQVNQILDHAEEFGGVVTINWHDRSIAPERLWRSFYIELLDELARRGAWLTSAAETVRWFRKRRMTRLADAGNMSFEVNEPGEMRDLPAIRVRVGGS